MPERRLLPQGDSEPSIDWERARFSCVLALAAVLPFSVFVVGFSGDSHHSNPFGYIAVIAVTLTLAAGFLVVATYIGLTVLDWIWKHV